MQRIKRSTSPSLLSTYTEIINHVHDFLNTLLKEPDGFSKYIKFLINYRGQILENCYLNMKETV